MYSLQSNAEIVVRVGVGKEVSFGIAQRQCFFGIRIKVRIDPLIGQSSKSS